MRLIEVENYQEMSEKVCQLMINRITDLTKPVLGLATGSTPERLYQLLVEVNQKDVVSFQDVTTFNLDEYIGLEATDPNSYRYYMNDKLFNHIDIPDEQTHIPNGRADDSEQECARYEALIQQVGGIDIQLLGLGLNGHIGFNEPGTSFKQKTHVVELEESTRKANARFFESIDDVPTHAITMGINTIMQSKEIMLMVSGEKKAGALDRLLNGEVTEEFPASILNEHDHVTIVADKAALLTSSKTK
ncbi:glucosamine-6-phosphate deaminase [Aquibacillus sediminis]|uniref:glucosamine-6-phosphate deaminase n=1 Tax=Aquibacillus sediminis TaxID=2574734 RepID=UPI001108E247|nr:glucosamine-6-phosphate deaminase [Aquibacillus sediminis]